MPNVGTARLVSEVLDSLLQTINPVVIRMILAHLDKKGVFAADSLLPDCRASPDPPTGLLV